MKFALLVFGYAVSMAGSNLLFKVASEKEGTQWWLWFLAGNEVGFGCPVLITYALREQSPHLVYATRGLWAILLEGALGGGSAYHDQRVLAVRLTGAALLLASVALAVGSL